MSNTSTLKQHAYRYLRNQIILGEIRPGSRLTEEAIAKETGVSRGPIREAIRQLDSEGIVRHVAHQGATVMTPSDHDIRELADLRASVESGVAARAAERARPWVIELLNREINRLTDLLQSARNAPSPAIDEPTACELARIDLRFHSIVMEAAESPRASRTLRDLRLLSYVWGLHRVESLGGAELIASRILEDHTRIIKAIREQNSREARDAMLDHLRHDELDMSSQNHAPRSIPLFAYPSVRQLLLALETPASEAH